MAEPGSTSGRAGGFILAMAILGGAVIGILMGEPSAGVVGGAALGTVIAIALWWRDRRSGTGARIPSDTNET